MLEALRDVVRAFVDDKIISAFDALEARYGDETAGLILEILDGVLNDDGRASYSDTFIDPSGEFLDCDPVEYNPDETRTEELSSGREESRELGDRNGVLPDGREDIERDEGDKRESAEPRYNDDRRADIDAEERPRREPSVDT